MGYVTIDIEITPSTKGSGLYKIDANIKGVNAAFRSEKKALEEEIPMDLKEWKDLNNALNSLRARGVYDEEKTQVKEFGKSLFRQVIRDSIYTLYRNGKDYSSRRGHLLRLRLHAGLPELIELPWELLCEEGMFIGLTTARPRILIIRCPMGIEPIKTVGRRSPLQVMVMTAEPKSYPDTDAKQEKKLIKEALKEIEAKGSVSLKDMEGKDTELENIYVNRTLDIFHFIGHGCFNEITQEGELVLEDVSGNAKTIPADKFSLSLPNSVKLVFLNACESARGNSHEPFSSIAYILAKQGLVVIAMQFRISSNAAVRFANTFYTEIASGKPIDEAVSEARHRVFTMADCCPLDWAAPVLYMKSDNGVLFEIKDPSPPIVAPDEEENESAAENPDTPGVSPEELDIPSPSGFAEPSAASPSESAEPSTPSPSWFAEPSAASPSGSAEPSTPLQKNNAVSTRPSIDIRLQGTQKWVYSTSGPVQSSPTVFNGVVYVGSNDHYLYALDIIYGREFWQPYATRGPVRSSPTVFNGVVYFGSDDHKLYALDATSGEEEWSLFTTVLAAVQSSPTVVNGIVYFGSNNGKLYALNATSGEEKWSVRPSVLAAVRSSPTVASGVVYFGSSDHKLYALNASSGRKIWSFPTGNAVGSSPTVVDGIIYFGSGDKSFYALYASSKQQKWFFQTGGKVQSSPTVVNGVVYVGSDDGNLYALDTSSGKKIWSFPTSGPVRSSPTVVNGVVYVGSDDGNLYALDTSSGKKIWSFPTGGPVRSSPTVVDGVVYVGSDDGNLYALFA